MRTGVLSTAWTYLTGRSRRRLRKKEKKKIDKVRFFLLPSGARRDSTRRACSRLERSIAAGARHDRVPQVPRVVVLQLG